MSRLTPRMNSGNAVGKIVYGCRFLIASVIALRLSLILSNFANNANGKMNHTKMPIVPKAKKTDKRISLISCQP